MGADILGGDEEQIFNRKVAIINLCLMRKWGEVYENN